MGEIKIAVFTVPRCKHNHDTCRMSEYVDQCTPACPGYEPKKEEKQ